MSSFAVKVERIRSVEAHPNADRLDLVQVLDWKCVSAKGIYKPGDLCVYFPIDSLLPADLEDFLFPPDAKIKLTKSRIRTIKLRGAISQGMCISVDAICDFLEKKDPVKEQGTTLMHHGEEGWDLTEALKVTKYEPPEPGKGLSTKGQHTSRKSTNPYFHKYTDIENAKNYPDLFTEGEQVVVTEKIHGTNFRAGYVRFHANTLWKKIKAWLRLTPQWEFVYGSHNVQLQDRYKGGKTWLQHHGQTENNVYAEAVAQYDLKNRIPKNVVIYGEIYGDGIQKGYTYGCKPGKRGLVLFDIKRGGDYLGSEEFSTVAKGLGLPQVPVLYKGPFNKEKILSLREGDSVLAPEQKVREGVVVRSDQESTTYMGRKLLKFINDQYLLKDQTDFH